MWRASSDWLALEPLLLMIAKAFVALALVTATLIALGGIWYTWDRSEYSREFDEEKFNSVSVGMTTGEVQALLGAALIVSEDAFPETWYYQSVEPSKLLPTFRLDEPRKAVEFDSEGKVTGIRGLGSVEVATGDAMSDVRRILGEPSTVVHKRARCAHYSRPPEFGRFRARILAISSDGRVTQIFAYDTYD